MTRLVRTAPLTTAIIVLMHLAGSAPTLAHNGSVAVAYPIRGITVDGDLSDWPDSRTAYPVGRAEVGPAPADSADFRGWFRVAYDVEQSSLYLAAEVEDDVVVDTAATWNGSDGCEVFIDLAHGREESPCVQNMLYGTHQSLSLSGYGADASTIDSSHAELAFSRSDGRHQYEWRLDVGKMGSDVAPLQPGMVLGLDVVLGDRDEDGEFTWIAWGRGVGKLGAPQSRGDLILAGSPEAMGAARGRVRWSRESEGIAPRRVLIASRDEPERFWVQLNTAKQGRYEVPLPAGTYRAEAVDVRVSVKDAKTRRFSVQAGRTSQVKDLVIKPVRKRGVLVDQLFDHLESGDPGAAVLVARDGEVLYRQGYGLANVELGVPITPEFKFRLASVSKQFTAVAVMQLAEKGLVDIDASVSTYLPDYPSGDRVTARQLMAHTAGVPNILSISEYWDICSQHRDLPGLIDLFRDLPLEFEPDERRSYSNSGYVLLADLVEKVSGQTFGEYLQENIFQPLGMENSGSVDQSAILPNRASGYLLGGGELVRPYYLDFDLAIGLGGVYSTVDDLFVWDEALYSGEVLSTTALQTMFSRQVLNDGSEAAYGLGWRIGQANGLREIAHSGLLNGFTTRFARFPDQHFLVVLLCNNPRLYAAGLAAQIAEIYLSNAMDWGIVAQGSEE